MNIGGFFFKSSVNKLQFVVDINNLRDKKNNRFFIDSISLVASFSFPLLLPPHTPLGHRAIGAVNVGGPIAIAGGGVKEKSRRAGPSHATVAARALEEVRAVVGDADGLSGGRAFTGFRLRGLGRWFVGVGSGSVCGFGWLGSAGGRHDRDSAVEENVDDGGEKRILAFSAEAALEIVEIQSPDHSSTETFFLDVLRLDTDGSGIVVSDPLISAVGVHDFVLRMVLGRPTALQVLADFVIGEESLFAGVLAGGAGAFSRRPHARFGRGERESSAVSAETHDELVGGKAQLHKVVDGPIDVEQAIVAGLVGARVKGDVSAGVLLPGAVKIVGHEVDKVHLLGQLGDFVSGVDSFLTAADGGG